MNWWTKIDSQPTNAGFKREEPIVEATVDDFNHRVVEVLQKAAETNQENSFRKKLLTIADQIGEYAKFI